MLVLGLMFSASTLEEVSISAVIIGPGSRCPSDADRQDALQLLGSRTEQVIQNYSINPNCGPGLWRQVFYLNTSSQDQSCPGDWNVYTVSSVRGCVGADISCQSAYSDEAHYHYNKVCGRVIGLGGVSPDGFYRYISGQTTIEGNYLDGLIECHTWSSWLS